MNKNYITKTLNLRKGDAEQKRQEILEYFHKTYDIDEKLYETLKSEDTFYMRPDQLRHPLIFYYGHTAAFYINKLILAKLIDERVNPTLESMFAVGVDEMSWDDLNEAHYDWPTLAEVQEFRNKVRKVVEDVIGEQLLQLPIEWNSPFWVVMMGIEHQRIHLETSSVLIRELPITQVKEHPLFPVCEKRSNSAPQNELLPVQGGRIELGKNFDHPLYGWDNEYGSKIEDVDDFKASKYLVSNLEFKEFIEANGYHNKQHWTEEGWNWREYKQAEHPVFWVKKAENWCLRTMTKEIPMPWNWPVVVNYLEAKAFTNWLAAKSGRKLRLPTEAEWYTLYNKFNLPDQPDWDKAPGNINLEYYASSCPVDEFRFKGFYDVIGNVWQWTETPIFGYDGFKVHPCYDDFSTPTFDGKHNLFKGGSWISTGNEATAHARYAFRRHFYQHAGFRYVESEQEVKIEDRNYEEDENVIPYCARDYGKMQLDLPNYSHKLAKICFEISGDKPISKALDIGCKTGRTTFELAKQYDFVTGLDFTARQIRNAVHLQEEGNLLFTFYEEGKIQTFHEITLTELGLSKTTDKVEFYQADPSNLVKKYTGYDLVLVENMLREMYDPRNFLKMIHERINKDGILIIVTSKNWELEDMKERSLLGGYRKDGEPVRTHDTISDILSDHFTEVEFSKKILHYLPRDSSNLEINVCDVLVWKKK